MKNNDEMYQNVLSRYNEIQEKKKKRIWKIKHTVPVLASFCFAVVFGLGIWDNLAKLPSIPMQSEIIDQTTMENIETSANTDTTESRETNPAVSDTVSGVTTASIPDSETNHFSTSKSTQIQTVTTTISGDESGGDNEQETLESKETKAPTVTVPIAETKSVMEVQTTAPVIQIQPVSNVQTTSLVQTTAEPIKTIVTETDPVNDNDSRLLYPIGKQINIESYKAMAIASYMVYNDIDISASTTTQTTAPIQSETTTTTVTTDDQQTALEKLAEKEHIMFGEFQRERAVILGELSPDAERLTLDEVNEIIESSSTYDEICEKLHEAQPYADYYGGSGVTLVEYWFDDKGSKKIFLILEQEDVFYYHFKEVDKIYF